MVEGEEASTAKAERKSQFKSLTDENAIEHMLQNENIGEEPTTSTIPAYMIPSLSSTLPVYSNSEQDYIRRAFQSANYDRISNLPDNIKEEEVMKARTDHIDDTLNSRYTTKSLPKGTLTKTGLFQEFEYIPSRYTLADELASIQRIESEQKRSTIAELDFAPTGTIRKLKHEDGFQVGKNFPYVSDPYESAVEQILMTKWSQEEKRICGPFIPSGRHDSALVDNAPGAPTRLLMQEVMESLKKVIQKDWEGAVFEIFTNKQEEWVIRFDLKSIESETGLSAYMNVFIRCNDEIIAHGLTKVSDQWSYKPDENHIVFTLRPPWVHVSKLESFYKLHPTLRTYKSTKEAEAAMRAAAKASSST